MPLETAADVAAFFDEFAEDAVYTPAAGGEACAVKVILDNADEVCGGGVRSGVIGRQPIAKVRKRELAAPAENDTLKVPRLYSSWTVAAPPISDVVGEVWTLMLREVV